MLLTLKERLLILAALPPEGDLLTMRIVRDLKAGMGVTEEEFKEYEIVSNANGSVSWNSAKDKGVEKEVGDKAKEIIVAALKELDNKKKITDDHVTLWERFEVKAEEVKL